MSETDSYVVQFLTLSGVQGCLTDFEIFTKSQEVWKSWRNVPWKFYLLHDAMNIQGTLMQIWKSPYMFVVIQKQYPAKFTFLILNILELFAREVCKFPKK